MVRLGDICDVHNGYAFRSKEYTNDGHRVIRITNVQKGIIVDDDPKFYAQSPVLKRYELFDEDLLISLTGNVGRVGLISNKLLPAYLNQRVACLREKTPTISKKYLFSYLNTDKFEQVAVAHSKGLAQKNMSTEWLKEYLIPLPPLEVQQQIAEVLDRAIALIAKRKRQIDKLDLLVKSRYIKMFGDPVSNLKGWEVAALKNLAIGKLSYGSGASAIEYDCSVRYVRITDINDNGELDDEIVSPSEYDNKYLLYDGDILFARSGSVGKTFRYNVKWGKCIFAGYLIRFVPDTDKVLPDYVFVFTKTGYYQSFVKRTQRVVAQPNINAKQYGNLLIPVPPLALQARFVDFVQQVETQKALLRKSLAKLEQNYKSIVQKYFRGEILS